MKEFKSNTSKHTFRTICLVAMVAMVACSHGKTNTIDLSAEDGLGGTGIETRDVRAMAEQIARGVSVKLDKIDAPQGMMGGTDIQNASRFRIDTRVIRKKLTHDLVMHSESATFLARDAEVHVIGERTNKRAGKYDHHSLSRAMRGADYFLIGEMRGLSKQARRGYRDYLIYSFELVDAETGAIVWADDYETQRVAKIDVVYQ